MIVNKRRINEDQSHKLRIGNVVPKVRKKELNRSLSALLTTGTINIDLILNGKTY